MDHVIFRQTEETDQARKIPRQISGFAGHKCHLVGCCQIR